MVNKTRPYAQRLGVKIPSLERGMGREAPSRDRGMGSQVSSCPRRKLQTPRMGEQIPSPPQ